MDGMKLYEGETVNVVSLAIRSGCVVPEMRRVCGGQGWGVYAVVDVSRDTRASCDGYEPLFMLTGTLPYSDAVSGDEELDSRRELFMEDLGNVMSHYLVERLYLRDGYKGAC